MGTQIQFGANYQQYTPSTAGKDKANRQMEAVARQSTSTPQLSKIAKGILNVATQQKQIEEVEANRLKAARAEEAKGKWLRLKNDHKYLDADAVGKLTMINEYRDSFREGSDEHDPGYLAALQYSSGQYAINYKQKIEQEDLAALKAAYSGYMAEKDRLEQLKAKGAPVDLDNFAKKYVDSYAADNPRLSKPEISRALLGGMYQDAMQEVLSVPDTREGWEYANNVIKEIKAPYQDSMFLTTKEKRGSEYINKMEAKLQNLLNAKRQAIILADSNDIEYNKASGYTQFGDDEAMRKFIFKHTKPTGEVDYAAVDKDMNSYLKEKTETLQYNAYVSNFTPTVPLPKEFTQNPKIKKEHPYLVAKAINSSLQKGRDKDFINIVNSNAGYLKEAKRQSMAYLFNKEVPKEDRAAAWQKTKALIEDPEGALAVKKLFGEDFSTVLAVKDAMDYIPGMDLDTATEMAAKLKADPDAIKIHEKDVLIKMNEDAISYGTMNNEFRKIVSLKMAMGVDEDTAYKTTRELFDERVTEIGGVQAFEVSGKAPIILDSKAKEIYEGVLERQLQKFKEANNNMPIRVDILADGKAVVKSADIGVRLKSGNKTYIDLKKLEKIATEKAAYLKRGKGDEITKMVSEGLYDMSAKASNLATAIWQSDAPKPIALYLLKEIVDKGKAGAKFVEESYDELKKGFDSIIEYFDGEPIREDLLDDVSKELMQEEPLSLNNPYRDNDEVNLDKLVALESGGDYNAINPKTKAFGKYQLLPSTAKEYAKKLGIKEEEVSKPENQDLMFAALTADNMKALAKKNIPINTFTVYAAHQQGVRGAEEILKGKPLSKARIEKIKGNLPYSKEVLDSMTPEELRQAWIEYYKQRTL